MTSTYTISEAAERSGFSASALRYYEGIGLVAPSTRTEASYRLCDDHALARLSFIARAKRLGCSLARRPALAIPAFEGVAGNGACTIGEREKLDEALRGVALRRIVGSRHRGPASEERGDRGLAGRGRRVGSETVADQPAGTLGLAEVDFGHHPAEADIVASPIEPSLFGCEAGAPDVAQEPSDEGVPKQRRVADVGCEEAGERGGTHRRLRREAVGRVARR